MKKETINDKVLLQLMRLRICNGCGAFECYCRNCVITNFAKKVDGKNG